MNEVQLDPSYFPGMTTNDSAFYVNKSPVPTADVGVQTITTGIPRFPLACPSHIVPWGLLTEDPSPLTYQNRTVEDSFNCKKHKLEDSTACRDSTRPSFFEFLNGIFDLLNSPSNKDEYPKDKKIVSESRILYEYDSVVDVDHHINMKGRSIATIHIPMRRGAPQCVRYKDWYLAANQFLNEEDRLDKRGQRQVTINDRTNRMTKAIWVYHCRQSKLNTM